MADQTIKIEVQLDPDPAKRGAQEVGRALDGVNTTVERVGRSLREQLSGPAFAALRGNVAATYGVLRQGADSLARASGEAERLSRANRTLGLDFNSAARGAGGVVDELELLNTTQALTARGVMLNQTQLQAFARTAQDYARGSGREFSAVAEQLAEAVAKGGEEAARFGPALGSLAAPTATATDRLDALVRVTRESAPAAHTAAESYLDLQQALTETQRGFSEGFAEGIAEMRRVHGETASARDVVREMKDEIYALGGTTATVFVTMADAFSLVKTEVSGVVASVMDAQVTLARMVANPLGAGQALRGLGARSGARHTESAAALQRLLDDLQGRQRTNLDVGAGAPGAVAPARGRPVGNETEGGNDGGRAADFQAYLQQSARGGSGRSRGAANDNTRQLSNESVDSVLARAVAQATEANSRWTQRLDDLDAAMNLAVGDQGGFGTQSFSQQIRGATRVTTQDAQRLGTPDDLAVADRAADAQLARERSRLDERYELQRSFTDRWEELHGRQANATQMVAESGTQAFQIFGQALGKHINAVREGQEGVADAAQATLSDTLTAIGSEAIVKGALQFAEGAAMLAGIITAPKAPGHFLAGAAYVGVGTLAASLGGAIAPSPSAPVGASGGSAPSAPIGALGTASDNAERSGPTEITINLGGGVVMGNARELGEALGRVINDPTAGVSINPQRVRRGGRAA